jgi:anti-anti-sigma factor
LSPINQLGRSEHNFDADEPKTVMTETAKIIEPAGVLDSNRGNQLRQEISTALASGAKNILVDLQQVSFMDSSGLGALVSSLKTARSAGAEFYVCSVADQVQMLFEMTHMNRVFQILADQNEFRAKFQVND